MTQHNIEYTFGYFFNALTLHGMGFEKPSPQTFLKYFQQNCRTAEL
jgi:hypothetical protein